MNSNVMITISDAVGRKIRDIPVQGPEGDIAFNSMDMASGVYFYSLVINGRVVRTNKMVVL